MSHTRPVYRTVITNRTSGWTYTAEQGDDSTLDDPVQLVDPLTIGWSMADETFGPVMDPETLTFTLRAATAGDLPTINQGDLITADLIRPTTTGPTRYWMRFVGRAAEPTARATRGHAFLTINATGLTADLAAREVSSSTWPQGETAMQRATRIADAVSINLKVSGGFAGDNVPLGALKPEASSALDLLAQLVTGSAFDLLRSVRYREGIAGPQLTYDDVEPSLGFRIVSYFTGISQAGWSAVAGDRPLKLTRTADVVDVTYVGTDPTDRRQLPAVLVDAGIEWRKDRSSPNRASIELIAETSNPNANTVAVAQYRDRVRRYGPNTLELTSQIMTDGINTASAVTTAASWLALAQGTDNWSAEGITVYTERMTDAQLDLYSASFWPDWDPVIGEQYQFPMQLQLVDVDDDWQFTGSSFAGSLLGCTFTIAGGELTISPAIRATPFTPEAKSITWAQLASTFPTAKWSEPVRRLVWSDLVLTSI